MTGLLLYCIEHSTCPYDFSPVQPMHRFQRSIIIYSTLIAQLFTDYLYKGFHFAFLVALFDTAVAFSQLTFSSMRRVERTLGYRQPVVAAC